MNAFKIGDTVECIDAAAVDRHLTSGSQYTVVAVSTDGMVFIYEHDCRAFYPWRFKLIRRDGSEVMDDFSNMMAGKKPTQKFYMVFREDSRLPEVKHTNGVDATVEAQRLAKKYPGSKVFILKTVDCFLCTVSEPESVDIDE